MRRTMNRALSVLTAFALALSIGTAAQAEETSGAEQIQTEEISSGAEDKVLEALDLSLDSADTDVDPGADLDMRAVNEIPVTKWITGDEGSGAAGSVMFTNESAYQKTDDPYCYGYSEKVSLTKGVLVVGIANNTASYGDVWLGVWDNPDLLGSPVANTLKKVSVNMQDSMSVEIPKAGTYYIGIYGRADLYSEENSLSWIAGAAAIFLNGADRTVKNGAWAYVGQVSAQTNYFKFKAVKTGYLTINIGSVDSAASMNKITLCNASKKALSDAVAVKDSPVYGVKKGTVYYIKIKATENIEGYRFKVTNEKISDKTATTKAKAVTLKRSKEKKGVIVAGSSKSSWYKFNLPKNGSMQVLVTGVHSGKLKVSFYNSKVKKSSDVIKNGQTVRIFSRGTMSKGTYWVQIERGNNKSSGYYTIRWE